MNTIQFSWEIHENKTEVIERYCHNCGKKTRFTDSGKRRHNANGKVIFEYAIYKCENDHTWNKALGTLDTTQQLQKEAGHTMAKVDCLALINITELAAQGYVKVEICISGTAGKRRLDATLSCGISNLSRNAIANLIKNERVLVNGAKAKTSTGLKPGHIISILLD